MFNYMIHSPRSNTHGVTLLELLVALSIHGDRLGYGRFWAHPFGSGLAVECIDADNS
jgi:prepilin-type N-terminal cleavage/methylation domain-containing protein